MLCIEEIKHMYTLTLGGVKLLHTFSVFTEIVDKDIEKGTPHTHPSSSCLTTLTLVLDL